MKKTKKIVYLDSDSDDNDGGTVNSDKNCHKPSFISGQINRHLDQMQRKVQTGPVFVSNFLNPPKAIIEDVQEDCANLSKPTTVSEECVSSTKHADDDIIILSDEEASPRSPKRPSDTKKTSPQKVIQVGDYSDEEPDIIQNDGVKPLHDSLSENIGQIDLSLNDSLLAEANSKPMKIKLKRMDRIEYFSILRNQPFSDIYDDISQMFDIPVPNIILYLDDNQIDPKATLESLNLTIADILEVLARSNAPSTTHQSNNNTTANDPNFVTLHLKDTTKKKITLRVNRFQTVKFLAESYAKEKGVLLENVTFQFDSDQMDFDKKIDYYEMDNDEQIDVVVHN